MLYAHLLTGPLASDCRAAGPTQPADLMLPSPAAEGLEVSPGSLLPPARDVGDSMPPAPPPLLDAVLPASFRAEGTPAPVGLAPAPDAARVGAALVPDEGFSRSWDAAAMPARLGGALNLLESAAAAEVAAERARAPLVLLLPPAKCLLPSCGRWLAAAPAASLELIVPASLDGAAAVPLGASLLGSDRTELRIAWSVDRLV